MTPLVAPPLFGGNVHPRFVIDAQALGDTRDVIEIADDLSGDGDLFVRKPALSQSLDIALVHGSRREREFNGVVAQRAVVIRQIGQPIVED